MNAKQRAEFGHYVRACADLMELRDWTINLFYEKPESPSVAPEGHEWHASLDPVPGRKNAALAVDPADLVARDVEETRQMVAHELVHCHFAALWHQLRMDLLDHLGQQAYDLFIASVERNMEHGVDAVSDAIAPRLPLIEWPT